MSEARHEVLTKPVGAPEQGAGASSGAVSARAPTGALGNIANASAKSGVHSTDVLQRDAFTRDALRRMAPTTRPPANIPDYEAAARVTPEPSEPDSSLARARRELLRMAGEDLPVAQPAAFGDEAVTTQRAQAFFKDDRDEDTVIQDVSELLAAADAQLDALTTEIRSVVTPLPPPPFAEEREPVESELEIEVSEFCAREDQLASAPVEEAPAPAVAIETPHVTPAHLAALVRQTAREAAPPVVREISAPLLTTEVASSAPPRVPGRAKRVICAALLVGACAGLVSLARLPASSPAAPPASSAPARALSAAPAPEQPASVAAAQPAATAAERVPAPSMLAALQGADEEPAVPSSESASSLVARGQAALRAGQLRPARQWLAAAASREPMNPHAYAGLTEVDLLLGVPERALVAAQTALKLRPRRARYHLLVARVYDALGRPEDAAESRRQAQVVAPYDPDQPRAGEPAPTTDATTTP